MLFRTGAKRFAALVPQGSNADGAARVKGGYSLSEEREYPPWTPKRTRGENPSTPDIGSLQLEELHALRIAQPLAALLPYGCGIPLAGNRVRCTWLRHESSASRYR